MAAFNVRARKNAPRSLVVGEERFKAAQLGVRLGVRFGFGLPWRDPSASSAASFSASAVSVSVSASVAFSSVSESVAFTSSFSSSRGGGGAGRRFSLPSPKSSGFTSDATSAAAKAGRSVTFFSA